MYLARNSTEFLDIVIGRAWSSGTEFESNISEELEFDGMLCLQILLVFPLNMFQ